MLDMTCSEGFHSFDIELTVDYSVASWVHLGHQVGSFSLSPFIV
jgi:hypothetical protein